MDKGTGYTDDEIFSSVKFVGQESAPVLFNNQQSLQGIPPNTDGVTIIKIIFGKKSKECEEFGICRVIVGPIIIYDRPNPFDIYLPYDKKLFEGDVFNLYLASKPDIDMTDVILPIDEDILIHAEGKLIATMVADKYEFSPKIGEYGGYAIKLKH